jgi:hypothetical protein
MKTYEVMTEHVTSTTIRVKAHNRAEAEAMVEDGQYEVDDILDVQDGRTQITFVNEV